MWLTSEVVRVAAIAIGRRAIDRGADAAVASARCAHGDSDRCVRRISDVID